MENNQIPLELKGISKEYIKQISIELVDKVNNGDINPLELLSALSGLDKVCKNVRSNIIDNAVDEFDKHGLKEVSINGCTISKMEAGTKYDFSNTDLWNKLKSREQILINERKDLEAKLKTFKKAGSIVVDDEIIDVNPPIKTSKTTIKISIK